MVRVSSTTDNAFFSDTTDTSCRVKPKYWVPNKYRSFCRTLKTKTQRSSEKRTSKMSASSIPIRRYDLLSDIVSIYPADTVFRIVTCRLLVKRCRLQYRTEMSNADRKHRKGPNFSAVQPISMIRPLAPKSCCDCTGSRRALRTRTASAAEGTTAWAEAALWMT